MAEPTADGRPDDTGASRGRRPRRKSRTLRRRHRVVLLAGLVAVAGAGTATAWLVGRQGRQARTEEVVRSEQGLAALRAGRADEAVLHYEAALASAPDNDDVRRNLMLALRQAGRVDDAATHAAHLLRSHPDLAPAHAVLSQQALAAGNLQRAYEAALAATRGEGVADTAQLAVAEILLAQGRTSEALVALEEAAASTDFPPEILARIRTIQAAGGERLTPRLQSALVHDLLRTKRQLDAAPFDPVATVRAAELQLLLRRPQETRALLEATAGFRPLDAAELALLACARAADGDPEQAVAAATEARGLPESDPVDLERAFRWAGRPQEALDVLDAALVEQPDDTRLLRARVRAAAALLRDHPEDPRFAALAESAADAVLAQSPVDEVALITRARARLATERPREALADLQALPEHVRSKPETAWLTGIGLIASGRPRSGLAALPRAEDVAASPGAVQRVLRTAIDHRNAAVARDWAERVVGSQMVALHVAVAALNGDRETAHRRASTPDWEHAPVGDRRRAALCLLEQGDPSLAVDLVAALAERNSPRVHMERGLLCEALGRWSEAAAAYERGAADPAWTEDALVRLGRLAVDGRDGAPPVASLVERLRDGAPVRALVLEGRAAARSGDAAALEQVLARLPDAGAGRAEVLELRLLGPAPPDASGAEQRERDVAELLELEPENDVALRLRARHLLEQARTAFDAGRVDVLQSRLDEAAELGPAGSPAQALSGLLHLAAGRIGEVRATLDALRATPGAQREADVLAGLLAGRAGDWASAADAFGRAAEADPRSVVVQAHLAATSLAAGRPDDARRAIEAFRELAPDDVRADLLHVLLLRQEGERQTAADQLDRIVQSRADAAAPRVLRARLLLTDGQTADALARLGDDIAALPRAAELRVLQVLAHLASNDAPAAMAAARTTSEVEGLAATGALLQAHVCRMARDVEQEATFLEQALERDPQAVSAHRRLGRIRMGFGDHAAAAAHYERVLERLPGDVTALVGRAMLAAQEGDTPRAVDLYERALDGEPRHVLAANNLAGLLLRRPGGERRALELARTAVDAAPDLGPCHDTLAQALERADDPEGAARHALRARELAPQDAEIAVRCVETLLRAGRASEAATAASSTLSRIQSMEGFDPLHERRLERAAERARSLTGAPRDDETE